MAADQSSSGGNSGSDSRVGPASRAAERRLPAQRRQRIGDQVRTTQNQMEATARVTVHLTAFAVAEEWLPRCSQPRAATHRLPHCSRPTADGSHTRTTTCGAAWRRNRHLQQRMASLHRQQRILEGAPIQRTFDIRDDGAIQRTALFAAPDIAPIAPSGSCTAILSRL
jgi:hypothetical protein